MKDYVWIVLDGDKIESRRDLHRTLEDSCSFCDYYGGNLDALEDLLSSYRKVILLDIRNEGRLRENLGNYFDTTLEVFRESPNKVFINLN